MIQTGHNCNIHAKYATFPLLFLKLFQTMTLCSLLLTASIIPWCMFVCIEGKGVHYTEQEICSVLPGNDAYIPSKRIRGTQKLLIVQHETGTIAHAHTNTQAITSSYIR